MFTFEMESEIWVVKDAKIKKTVFRDILEGLENSLCDDDENFLGSATGWLDIEISWLAPNAVSIFDWSSSKLLPVANCRWSILICPFFFSLIVHRGLIYAQLSGTMTFDHSRISHWDLILTFKLRKINRSRAEGVRLNAHCWMNEILFTLTMCRAVEKNITF